MSCRVVSCRVVSCQRPSFSFSSSSSSCPTFIIGRSYPSLCLVLPSLFTSFLVLRSSHLILYLYWSCPLLSCFVPLSLSNHHSGQSTHNESWALPIRVVLSSFIWTSTRLSWPWMRFVFLRLALGLGHGNMLNVGLGLFLGLGVFLCFFFFWNNPKRWSYMAGKKSFTSSNGKARFYSRRQIERPRPSQRQM